MRNGVEKAGPGKCQRSPTDTGNCRSTCTTRMKKLPNIRCFCTFPDHSSNHDYNVRFPVQTLLQTALDRYRQSTLRAKLPRSRSEKPDIDPVKRRRSSSYESVFPVRKTGCQYQSHTCHQSESSMNANNIWRQHTYIKGSYGAKGDTLNRAHYIERMRSMLPSKRSRLNRTLSWQMVRGQPVTSITAKAACSNGASARFATGAWRRVENRMSMFRCLY